MHTASLLYVALAVLVPIDSRSGHEQPRPQPIGHDAPIEFDIAPGASTTSFLYSHDDGTAVLFAHVMAATAGLQLRAFSPPSDSEPTVARSSDSTSSSLRINLRDGDVRLEVQSSEQWTGGTARIVAFACIESEETQSAGDLIRLAVLRARENLADGKLADCHAVLAACYDEIATMEAAGRSFRVCEALWSFGREAYMMKDHRTAEKAWRDVLRFREHAFPGDSIEVIGARGNLALAYKAQGKLEAAASIEAEMLVTLRQAFPEDHPNVVRAKVNHAATLRDMGDLGTARKLYEEILELALKQDLDSAQAASARFNLSLVLYDLGELAPARELQEAVLDTRTRTLRPHDPLLQNTRLTLANTLVALGEVDPAQELAQLTLELYLLKLPEDHPDVVGAKTTLALALAAGGDIVSAKRLEEEVLEVLTRVLPPEHPRLLNAQLNYAATLHDLGDDLPARMIVEEVLSVRSRILRDDHPDLLRTRLNLSMLLARAGQPARARTICEAALLAVKDSMPATHLDVLRGRQALANMLELQGNLTEALRHQEELVEELASTRDPTDSLRITASASLAYKHGRLGNVRAAAAIEEELLASTSDVLGPGHPDRLKLLENLVWSSWRAAMRETSRSALLQLADESLGTLQQALVLSVREQDARASAAISHAAALLSMTAPNGPLWNDAEYQSLAFKLCDRIRGLIASGHQIKRGGPGNREIMLLRQQIAATQSRISKIASQPGSQGVLREETSRRDRLERELADLVSNLLRQDKTAVDRSPEAITTRLDPDEALISFWKYDRTEPAAGPGGYATTPSYVAWVLRKGLTPTRVELGPAEPIDSSVESFRRHLLSTASIAARGVNAVRLNPGNDARAARQLSDLILTPLENALGDAATIWVMAAETLHLIPFDALPCGKGLLGDNHRILHLDHAAQLFGSRTRPEGTGQLLCVGGVDYDRTATDATVTKEDATPGPMTTESDSSATNDSSSGESDRAKFPLLPGTDREIDRIVSVFGASSHAEKTESNHAAVTVLRGAKATRESLEYQIPGSRYLHLATHGWFAPESVPSTRDQHPLDTRLGLASSLSLRERVAGLAPSLLCGIALAGANVEAGNRLHSDAIMTAAELASMDLSQCELAVLSACETSLGLTRAGQGIASLREALHAAGARCTITSLWKVDDEATTALMSEFYRNLWTRRMNPSEALAAAKSWMRNERRGDGSPRYSEYHWAAWVLSGVPD